ncbi:hypothetical protein LTWDN19_20940 (plasmid) [Latilactobacillus curvatus]|uniref:Uncharacterized protein n=1 Tax=Latilactobacillus curvatus TaxID=28038 RepID=A0ABM7QWR1_LATCU|nr:hypothetical protein B4V05_10135 [Latilactobacillus sakei]KGB13921.1 hypothetical protein KY41_10380 [Latilactobacillus sakei]UTB73297.1 hypothetical protein A4W72_11100 [Latilactobacillus curvatus]BCX31527.1 hypothetical protein LTWDN19_20940 [Latilactobacillus curvatus]
MNEKVKLIMKLTFNILLFLMGSSALCWYFFIIIYSGVFEDISIIKTYYCMNTLANVILKCVFGGSLFMVIQHSTLKILDDVITQIRLLIKY